MMSFLSFFLFFFLPLNPFQNIERGKIEMHIKTTLRYHFILIKMAITKKDNNKSQQGCGEIETLPLLAGM